MCRGAPDGGNCTRRAEVVMADIGHTGILGKDALKRWGASVNMTWGKVRLDPPELGSEGGGQALPETKVLVLEANTGGEGHGGPYAMLLEGVPGDDGGEDLWVATGVGAGTEVVHWVRVANWGPDPRKVHDGEVMGWWEGVEELWRAADTPQGQTVFWSGPERTHGTAAVETDTRRDPVAPREGGSSGNVMSGFAGVFQLSGEPMGWTGGGGPTFY